MSPNFLYPANPANVPSSMIDPSAAFKKEVSGVMGSIFLFFIVYALLLLLSIALIIGCFYGGIGIIINFPRIITIFAGLGLIGVGIMIFVFLVKFMFSVAKYDSGNIVEITEADQPALFGFIRQLTKDTQTKFPKKIYLSPDANACVFYDSSFWSMLFPVKKNLQIGLGLVNSLNISEFKAVMAHEFGHFSQRSMKLGIFVYNVNKVIYNMLFDNKSYASFLHNWAKLDGVFAFFANITAKIAQSIQWILRQMYGLINKKYMGLSRQMEFHADAVAASVSGSKSLCTALRRIEMAASCYDLTLEKCDQLLREKKISSNIYPNQRAMMLLMADQHKLPLENGLPVISDEFIRNNNISRINFKDQWASHPSTDDRIAHLNALAISAEISNEPAWLLFSQKEQLQEQITNKIYERVQLPMDADKVGESEFDKLLGHEFNQNSYPEEYLGFFNNRQVDEQEDLFSANCDFKDKKFADIFNHDTASLSRKLNSLSNDIELLKTISEQRTDIKTFDFDGIKHKRSDAPQVLEKLQTELKELKTVQQSSDKVAILYFLAGAARSGAEEAELLKNKYRTYFDFRKKADEFLKKMNEMLNSMRQIFSGQMLQIELINNIIVELKDTHEPPFKKELQSWIEIGAYDSNPSLKARISAFIGANYLYFESNAFNNEQLSELHTICNENWACVNKFIFTEFKKILQWQLKFRED
ncbi:MAG: M48 family metalloprotease [Sphingobacteriales bacterium]|nr:M48 family metalloprotease [Sphingobacteriales bacterium]